MFHGLPGGSPGPNAQGSWISLLIVFLLAAAIGVGFLYFWNEVSHMSFYGPMP